MKKRATINYLSNNELLHELNLSKKSYSYFVDDKYQDYGAIVNDLSEINEDVLQEARNQQAKYKNYLFQRNLYLKGMTKKEVALEFEKNKIDPNAIPMEDLVIRVMTDDHIPATVKEPKKTFLNRIKFPPFKHYGFIDGEWREVGRSHWEGGLDNGKFTIENGNPTNSLVKAMMLLVDRNSTKANFYGYCVDNETEALTDRGWLPYNKIEIEKDKILSMDLSDGKLKWSKMTDMYIGNYDGPIHKYSNDDIDFCVTPNHKFVNRNNKLVKIDDIDYDEEIHIMGDSIEDLNVSNPSLYQISSSERNNLIKRLLGERDIFIETNKDAVDGFVALCTLSGIVTSTVFENGKYIVTLSDKKTAIVDPSRFTKIQPSTNYNDVVWCPSTEYGTFVCRRNGKVYVTGNSYLDDMKGQALLQLSLVCLQFDESKSRNVFAYYTTTCNTCFIKIIKLEKKQRNIKDEIMQEQLGISSHAYQMDNEE